MNSNTMLKALLIFTVASVTSLAQTTDDMKIKQVLEKENTRVNSLLRGDFEPLNRVYADDYTLVTEDGSVQTKASRSAAIRRGSMKFEKIDIVERSFRVYGDTVIILAREKLAIKRDGKDVGGDLRLTRVYRRIGDEWFLLASHATAIR